MWGYTETQTGLEYSFGWTVPQCVLTLRLIALTFDVYDGQKNAKLLRTSTNSAVKGTDDRPELINEDTAVDRIPTLLELLSHAYFPASFVIGPQVKYKKYLKYIDSNENFLPKWY